MPISLIAGLGNPGLKYRNTRHNIGRVAVEALAGRLGAEFKEESRWKARVAQCEIGGRAVFLVIPTTYMNDSGGPLGAVCRYYKICEVDLAVACDEIQIGLGRVKISVGGGAGGHNGMEDVLEHFEEDIVRYRIGIGPKMPPQMDLKEFVLGKFTNCQQELVSKKMPDFVNGLKLLVDRGPLVAMNQVNQKENATNDCHSDKK